MEKELPEKCIGRSISQRSSLIVSLAESICKLEAQDAELKKDLLASIPKQIQEWLSQDGVLNSLFAHGKATQKILFWGEYGFGDLEDVRKKMAQLQRKWHNIVSIIVSDEPEPNRVEIRISVLL